MSKQFMAVLAAVVVGFGLIFWFTGSKNDNKSGGTSTSSAKPTSHIEGQGKKGVTLMEYGDYQCPVCGAYYATVKQVADQYSQDIFFQFRNLPLTQIHPNAFAAARAAEAAGRQGKYFEMHDMLYEQQQTWSTGSDPLPLFQSFAQQLSLDVNKFNSDYASAAVNDAIQADLAEFGKTGQQEATPTFFLDGKYLENSKLIDGNGPSVAKFGNVIKAEIAAKNK
ncbi:MAG: DsbA family protein [Candidatus Saccharimonadales bacterium]